jgi:hypothetical protein
MLWNILGSLFRTKSSRSLGCLWTDSNLNSVAPWIVYNSYNPVVDALTYPLYIIYGPVVETLTYPLYIIYGQWLKHLLILSILSMASGWNTYLSPLYYLWPVVETLTYPLYIIYGQWLKHLSILSVLSMAQWLKHLPIPSILYMASGWNTYLSPLYYLWSSGWNIGLSLLYYLRPRCWRTIQSMLRLEFDPMECIYYMMYGGRFLGHAYGQPPGSLAFSYMCISAPSRKSLGHWSLIDFIYCFTF